MGDWSYVDGCLIAAFLAAVLTPKVAGVLVEIGVLPPQVPAWLAAEYRAAASPADPEEGHG